MSKTKKQKQKYAKEYKLGAVKLITDQSYSYAEAGRSLGVAGNLISRWHKEFQVMDNDAFPGQGQLSPDQEEIRGLRQEVKQLKLEREILKKATAFFAREST